MTGRFDMPLKSGSGSRSLNGGFEDYNYRVNIDYKHVREMALKAAQSVGGRSQAGPIQIVITSRQRREG